MLILLSPDVVVTICYWNQLHRLGSETRVFPWRPKKKTVKFVKTYTQNGLVNHSHYQIVFMLLDVVAPLFFYCVIKSLFFVASERKSAAGSVVPADVQSDAL